MNTVQEQIAAVVTVPAAIKAVAFVSTLPEAADVLGDLIADMLNAVPTPGNAGNFCGILAYEARQKLMCASMDSNGLQDVYDAQAMIHGSSRSDDALPAQVAVLEVAAECIEQLTTLLELINPAGDVEAEQRSEVASALAKPEKDFLGHPNKTTEAFELFSSPVEDARKKAALDQRTIGRQVGINLLRVYERINLGALIFEAMLGALPNDTDSDAIKALLTMGDEYQMETANLFYGLAGEILVALEQGGLA